MAGNASFAIGSWVGKIVTTTGAEIPGASSDLAYAVYNHTTVVAPDGALTCTPHTTSPRIAVGKGETVSGDATMNIANGIVSVSADLKIRRANGNETPLKFERIFDRGIGQSSSVGLDGAYPPRDIGYSIAVATGTNDGHVVILPWRVFAPQAGSLSGVTVLDCQRAS